MLKGVRDKAGVERPDWDRPDSEIGIAMARVSAIHDEHEVFHMTDQRTELFEICCPEASSLSAEYEKRNLSAMRLGLHNGFDLSTAGGLRKAQEAYAEQRPKKLRISTPCGPTSTIQRLNH